ncbi:MAG: MBL fold metallo-hydrolase [Alphaproteobacteria bacterium]|nr:MBL fold metallo-hydrolase [Alphaproteobacteria bacterium]
MNTVSTVSAVRPEPLTIEIGTPVSVAPGILLLRLPLPFALDHINVYLLEDGAGWTLVDTGLDWADSRAAWARALAHPLVGGRPIRRMIVTHHHPDHIGLAGWHALRWSVPLEISAGEWKVSSRYGDPARNPHFERIGLWIENGMAPDDARARAEGMPSNLRMIHPLPQDVRYLAPNDVLGIGGRRWRCVVGRGHAPEHIALFCVEDDILLSGDHVLPRISPNISVWPDGPQNPLAQYLESLGDFAPLGRDPLVLPSHHGPFRGLATRVAEIRELHARRLALLEDFCGTPRTAHECLPQLFNRPLNGQQMAFAMGEAIAHLHCLAGAGRLERTRRDGIARFHRPDGSAT